MSILGSIFSKILGHHDVPPGASPAPTPVSDPAAAPPLSGTPASTSPSAPAGGTPAQGGAPPAAPATPAPPAAPAQAPAAPVDVAAMLDGLAAKSSQTLDWKHSIVDLMKLIGIDSSLSARQTLAKELHYTGDMHDSATMNIWLHAQVMSQLAANGGKVPDDLRH